MKTVMLVLLCTLMASCSTSGAPRGSVAWCGHFDYTGTWTKSQTGGKALGVSDSAVVERMTVEDVIALADAIGCND